MLYFCNYCNTFYDFKNYQKFGSHKGTCKCNPKRESSIQKAKEKRTYKRIKINKQCPKCENSFEVIRAIYPNGEIKPLSEERQYCSRKCANSHIQTEEQNKSRKDKLQGKSSKKIQVETKERHCIICNKKICMQNKSGLCKEHWIEEKRKTFEEKKLYRVQCQFKFNIYDFPNEFDLSLIDNLGIYKAKNRGDNIKGITRDHMLSIIDGFYLSIDPKIISHPANCGLITHLENVKKRQRSSISLEELLIRIEQWDLKYNLKEDTIGI